MSNKDLNVVVFSKVEKEFAEFYIKQKLICDELSGIKLIYITTKHDKKEIHIKKENFSRAIKRLNAFIINYSHNLDSKSKIREIHNDITSLEQRFVADPNYQKYMNKSKLNLEDKVEYNKLYFNYLKECFNLIVKFSSYLQTSMMINTANITKMLRYQEVSAFFDHLTVYRTEVSNDLSNFKLENIVEHYKRILGYHFTYRLFVDYKEVNYIDTMIEVCDKMIFNQEFFKFIDKVKDNNVNKEEEERLKTESLFFKNLFSIIYRLTNESLSNKEVLPRINRKILLDKTGI